MKTTVTTSTTGLAVVLLLMAALLGACGGGGDEGGEGAAGMAEDGGAGGGEEAPKSGLGQSGGRGGDVVARVVPGIRAEIRTATIRVQVDDVRGAARSAQDATERLGGVVAGAEIRAVDGGGPDVARATMTLRMPNSDLTPFLRTLAELGKELEITESTEDVSAEVADVASRIANQEASIAQLRRFMRQARQIEDVLRVEAELTRRQGDLEALQARQRVLEDRTALATVTAHFVSTPAEPGDAGGDDGLGFLTGLRNGWDAFVSVTLVAATVLGALLPFTLALALLAVPVALLWRARGRVRPRPAAE